MPMPEGSTLVIELWSSEDVNNNIVRKIEIKRPRLDLNDDPTYARGAEAKAKAEAIAQSGVLMSSKGLVFDMLANFYYKTTTKTPIVSQVQAREFKAQRAKASQGKE